MGDPIDNTEQKGYIVNLSDLLENEIIDPDTIQVEIWYDHHGQQIRLYDTITIRCKIDAKGRETIRRWIYDRDFADTIDQIFED